MGQSGAGLSRGLQHKHLTPPELVSPVSPGTSALPFRVSDTGTRDDFLFRIAPFLPIPMSFVLSFQGFGVWGGAGLKVAFFYVFSG